MKGYEHLTDTLEAYVAKKLSKQESEAFEQRMLMDEGLKEAVAMEQSLSSLVLENDLLQLNKRMTAELASIEKRAKAQRVFLSLLALVALSTCLYYVIVPSGKEAASIKKEVMQKADNKTLPSQQKEEESKIPTSSPKPRLSSNGAKEAPLTTQGAPRVSDPVETASIETTKKPVTPALQMEEPASKIDLPENAPTVPCSDKKIEAIILSKACLKNHSNGSIEIQLPSSHPTIQYSLDKHHFTPTPHFKQLPAGEHTVFAKENDCVTNLGKVTIKSTACISEYEKTYSPDVDLAWPIPILEGEAASFKIVDKTGNVVVESAGLEPSGVTWSGNTSNSGPAALGVYKVFIHYPSGESCVNSVTLFR